MRKKQFTLSMLVFLFIPVLAFAEEPNVAKLKQFLEQVTSLKSGFIQNIEDGRGGNDQSGGQFFMQKPGLFRWNYSRPFRQEIVSDGKKIWYYDADLNQVTVRPFSGMIGSAPILLLSGNIHLEAQFNIQMVDDSEGRKWIELTPKFRDDGFEKISIYMKGDSLAEMILNDHFGQTTRIQFINPQKNHSLASSLFTFSPPVGADVLETK